MKTSATKKPGTCPGPGYADCGLPAGPDGRCVYHRRGRHRGTTRPCALCGSTEGRPIDAPCHECAEEFRVARKIIEDQRRRAAEHGIYVVARTGQWWPIPDVKHQKGLPVTPYDLRRHLSTLLGEAVLPLLETTE